MILRENWPLHIKAVGSLTIIAYGLDGSVLWTRTVQDMGPNRIVTVGRQMMSRLLGGVPGAPITIELPSSTTVNVSGVGDLLVERMLWGSGGHNPSSGDPLEVSHSDEGLDVPSPSLSAGKSVTVSYPGTPPGDKSIEFTAEIDYSEANGETISEEAIFNDDLNLMFARKNFEPIVKASTFRLEFKHRIIF